MEKEVSEALARAKGVKKTDVNPVGTGKYMLEEARPGNYLKLKRNPSWWFGPTIGIPDMPFPDGIKITVIPDPSVQLANLRAGRLHFLALDISQYNLIKNASDLNVNIDPIKRQKIYFKFEKALYDNYEDVWLWWPMLVGILRKNVQGYGSERLRDQGGSAFWHSHPLWLEDGKPYYFQLWHRLPKKRNKYSCLLKFSIVAVYNRLISWGPHGKR